MAGLGREPGGSSTDNLSHEIDWETARGLCQIMCTNEEIASVLGVCYNTLNAHCKKKFNRTIGEWADLHRDKAKASIRRAQYKSAVEMLNPTLLIWLGKQYLDQTDKQDVSHKIVPPTIIDDVPFDDE